VGKEREWGFQNKKRSRTYALKKDIIQNVTIYKKRLVDDVHPYINSTEGKWKH
jgi:hypothetical protein